jgi:hypothetical protein
MLVGKLGLELGENRCEAEALLHVRGQEAQRCTRTGRGVAPSVTDRY